MGYQDQIFMVGAEFVGGCTGFSKARGMGWHLGGVQGFARSTRKDIRKTLAFSPNRCRIEGSADFKTTAKLGLQAVAMNLLHLFLVPTPNRRSDAMGG